MMKNFSSSLFSFLSHLQSLTSSLNNVCYFFPFRPIHKPLDDEHVSGNELDSSNEEEEESEDDPNKLWCICNQPHNNRFMICCDTCEEWYHGKCVNITKTMGQQMEAEGREWICLFCKVSKLIKRFAYQLLNLALTLVSSNNDEHVKFCPSICGLLNAIL